MSDYPNTAGFKEETTSRDAAEHIETTGRANILRIRVAEHVKTRGVLGSTADECAAALDESVLAIRPRFSELVEADILRRTKLTKPNESGRQAAICIHRSFYGK